MWKILCAGSAGRQLKLRNTSSSIVLPCAEEEARIWKLSRRREDRKDVSSTVKSKRKKKSDETDSEDEILDDTDDDSVVFTDSISLKNDLFSDYLNKKGAPSVVESNKKKKQPDETDSGVAAFQKSGDYVIVYTDGACSNNGKPGAKAGIGVWFGDNHNMNISKPVEGRATNNTAEIQACLAALEALKGCGVKKVELHTDSQFTLNSITLWIHRWKKGGWKTSTGKPVKNKEDFVKLYDCVSQFDDIRWRTFDRVISTATIRRRVLASGLRCRRPLRVPLLTARHHTARLQWARAHQDWLFPQWRNVLFSDESRFGLVSDDYRERVWRERGGQNRLATVIGVAPYRGRTQMFWGGIRFNGRTQLIHIPGTVTCAYYLQNIINAIVQPLRNEIGDQFIFMDDNARPHHRTRAVQQALETETLQDWNGRQCPLT
nr:unnamed protein product [Callosobruchus chinensis]